MTRQLILSTAIVLLVAGSAAAGEFAAGDRCKLSDSASVMNKPNGKRIAKLESGTELELLDAGGKWTKIDAGGTQGYVRSSWLDRVCKPLSAPKTIAAAPAADATPEPKAEPPQPKPEPEPEPTPPPQPAAEPEPEPASPMNVVPVDQADDGGFGDTYKIKVAVMDLRGSGNINEELMLALSNTVPETIDSLGPFKAISSQDILQMLAYEAQQQILGCDDVSCWAEVGGTLGADFLVTGSITEVEGTSIIQLQLLNTIDTKVENRVSRDHQGGGSELFETVRGAARTLMQPILGQHSGELAVAVSEEGATIAVNGTIVGVSPLGAPLTLSGGTHTLTVEKTGFIQFARDVMVTEAGQARVEAPLKPSAEYIQDYRSDAGLMRNLAWISIATGAAALGTGITLIAVGSEQAKAFNDEVDEYNAKNVRDSGQYRSLGQWETEIAALDSAAIPVLVLGVAAATTGVLLMVLGDDPYRYEGETRVVAAEPEVEASFYVLPGAAGMAVTF